MHSFQTLLKDLGTLAHNVVGVPESDQTFMLKTNATPFQNHVFGLAGVVT